MKLALSFLLFPLMFLTRTCATFDSIVAQDGSGNHTTISQAIAAAPVNLNRAYKIKIGSGVYNENVIIGYSKKFITLIGDGMGKTIIRASRSYGKGSRTYDSATLAAFGDNFTAVDLAIENDADDNTQAVALLVESNHAAFYRCRFVGNQDTLYVSHGAQFFRECEVYGNIDFIFGSARAVFQNCAILVKTPSFNHPLLVITAEGRRMQSDPDAIVLHNCTIKAATDDFPRSVRVFLGRPWKAYSRVIVMQSFLDKIIDPEGWMEWTGEPTFNLTATYNEFQNRGPGANTSGRVKWPGYKTIDQAEARKFTVRNFIQGGEWILITEIPVMLDLF